MRILICASEAPLPPLNGSRLVLRALARELAGRHELCVVAFRWPDQREELPPGIELHALDPPLPGLVGRTRDRMLSVLRDEPVDAVHLSAPMRRAVERLRAQRPFDIAHVALGCLAGVAPALADLPAIAAPLDAWTLTAAAAAAHAHGARRAWLRVQQGIVSRYVSRAYRPFARVVLVTPHDARETLRLDPTLHTAVIGNGVDTQYFQPAQDARRDRRCLLFTGTLSFPPNAEAARFLATDVLRRLRRALPDARLIIAGRRPLADVRGLAHEPGVSVSPDVPDLRPYLNAAGVFACAMRTGTGIKNKLLEAMACATPVVATSLACQGLAVRDGVELLIADDAAAFAEAVQRVLTDEALAARLGAAARDHVVAHHSWSDIAARYEALYREVLATHADADTAAAT
jgi:polysaccharide biosynthesis protein PslH